MIRDPHRIGLLPITDFDGARSAPMPQDRLRALRHRGAQFRERFLDEAPVRCARSVDLLRIPYPAWYAFSGVYAQQLLKPHMVHLLSRTVLIQFEDFEGQLRTLLFTPADFEAGGETPYFKRLSEQTPKFLHSTVAPIYSTVPQALANMGLAPAQIDYISYYQLHTQYLRRWLGTGTTPGLMPNAKLAAPTGHTYPLGATTMIDGNTYTPARLDVSGAAAFLAQVRQMYAQGTYEFEVVELPSTRPDQLQFQKTSLAPVSFTISKDGVPLQTVVVSNSFEVQVLDIGDTFYVYAVINGITADTVSTTNPNAVITAQTDDGTLEFGYFTLAAR